MGPAHRKARTGVQVLSCAPAGFFVFFLKQTACVRDASKLIISLGGCLSVKKGNKVRTNTDGCRQARAGGRFFEKEQCK